MNKSAIEFNRYFNLKIGAPVLDERAGYIKTNRELTKEKILFYQIDDLVYINKNNKIIKTIRLMNLIDELIKEYREHLLPS